jgi:ADP-ribose pyrophosphatase YjhB (NUDIX family)
MLEHPDEGAKRVLKEQLGASFPKISLSHVESFRAEGCWHLAFHYTAESEDEIGVHSSTDIAELRWFPLAELPDHSDVGFNGWALKTLKQILEKS